MENSFNLVSVIMILGGVQGLFLSILLFVKKKNEGISTLLLSIILFMVSLLFFLGAFHQARRTDLLIIYLPLIYPSILALGPLFYLYVKSLVQEDFKIKIVDMLYFFPFLFGFFFLSRIYFFPYEQQVDFISQFYSHNINLPETIFRYFDIAYRAVFIILSIKLLTDYREELKEQYSGLEKIDYNWLKQLMVYYLITIFVLLIVTVMNLDNDYRILMASYIAVIMYIIGYRITIRSKNSSPTVNLDKSNKKKKYSKTGLNDGKKDELKEKLITLVEKEKLFTDPDLSVGKLAEELNVTPNQVSQVINEKFNKSFYEFINGYRIEMAKEMLISEENKDMSILSIAFEVGFQSKSTFNAVFKKINQSTPSYFRKNHK